MAPIERISSVNFEYYDFMQVVRDVCEKRRLIREDEEGDSLSGKLFRVFTIGVSEEQAVAIVCIGNEEMENEDAMLVQMRNIGTEERPHVLIAPQDIIDEVNLEIEKMKEDAKFRSPSSAG